METHITSKGQVVIPANIRRKYNLKAGTQLHVIDTGNGILLKPVTEQTVMNLKGILKGKGGLKALVEERRLDVKRENGK
jgi:AbrB family looped-hinge helix DNA binding protein